MCLPITTRVLQAAAIESEKRSIKEAVTIFVKAVGMITPKHYNKSSSKKPDF
jgi:hypothetical protein